MKLCSFPSLLFPSVEQYVRAGEIARKVREEAARLVKPGASVAAIVEALEKRAIELGAELAFPINLSIDEVAAHDTASIKEERKIGEGDVVKVDIGVHIDGYIADTAITICFSEEYEKLVEAAEAALEKAIKIVRPGIELWQIGEQIEREIRMRGFSPIVNLSGHAIDRYVLHTGKTIPNVNNKSERKIEKGEVIAIEPFATTGVGRVIEGSRVEIYCFERRGKVRGGKANAIMKYAEERKLPFCKRWLAEKFGIEGIEIALRELEREKVLKGYPILREVSHAVVAQAEHTLIVGEEPLVIT